VSVDPPGDGVRRRRERWLSVLFVAVTALPVAEAMWRLDDWPASRVAMFSRRIAPTTPVRRIRLVGSNAVGQVAELGPHDLGLDGSEFARQLPSHYIALATSCSVLGRLYNERQRVPTLRLVALRAEVTMVQRPGGPPPPAPASWSVECRLDDG
jgi:hypothetical protein